MNQYKLKIRKRKADKPWRGHAFHANGNQLFHSQAHSRRGKALDPLVNFVEYIRAGGGITIEVDGEEPFEI